MGQRTVEDMGGRRSCISFYVRIIADLGRRYVVLCETGKALTASSTVANIRPANEGQPSSVRSMIERE